MIRFVQSCLSGTLMGGAYALIGIGMTLVFGVMRIINFAQGELVMVGMYLSYFLFTLFHIDPFVSVIIAAPLTFSLGMFLERVVIQKGMQALPENQILLTIGIGLVLSNAAMLLFTSDYKILSTSYSSSSFNIPFPDLELNSMHWHGSMGRLSLSVPLTFCFVITCAITTALYGFLMKTDLGQSIRATAQDRDAARLMGINIARTSMIAFGVGTALAGAAGSLLCATYYVYPQVGEAYTLKAFVVVVLGGMGSVIGATLGGLIIGVTESLAAAYLSSGVKELVVYVLFLLVLLFRPSGLLGKTRM